MGAWGVLAFDNDDANDWAYGLDRVSDLSLVESAFAELGSARTGYIEQGVACNALAACEVLARLRGRPGYTSVYTERVDRWVAAHRIDPPSELVARDQAVITRILGPESELRELWEDAGDDEWPAAVEDLRDRMSDVGDHPTPPDQPNPRHWIERLPPIFGTRRGFGALIAVVAFLGYGGWHLLNGGGLIWSLVNGFGGAIGVWLFYRPLSKYIRGFDDDRT